MLQTVVIECYRKQRISKFPSGKQMQISMLVMTHFPPPHPPKACQQFCVELIYDISIKLEITKCCHLCLNG